MNSKSLATFFDVLDVIGSRKKPDEIVIILQPGVFY